MSTETVQKVIEKALADAGFRQRLLSENDADKALEEFKKDLTQEEIDALKALKPSTFEGIEASVLTLLGQRRWT